MDNQTELITEALKEVFYKTLPETLLWLFKLIFLTPPTCYMVFGMIVFSIVLKVLEKKIKKNRKEKNKEHRQKNIK